MASEVMCALVADDPQNRYMVRMPETNSGAGEPIFPDHHRIGLPCAPNDRTCALARLGPHGNARFTSVVPPGADSQDGGAVRPEVTPSRHSGDEVYEHQANRKSGI